MRDFKFRAWHNNGPMKYNVGVHPFMIFRLSTNELLEEDEHYDDNTGDLIVAPGAYEIMQYIRLKDKNGKEIYEGDTTRDGYTIMWNEEKALFAEHLYQKVLLRWSIMSYPIDPAKIEIVGNIYENTKII